MLSPSLAWESVPISGERVLEATGAWAGSRPTALAEQDQLLHCKDPQVGLSLTCGQKSLSPPPPPQGQAAPGFRVWISHVTLPMASRLLPTPIPYP